MRQGIFFDLTEPQTLVNAAGLYVSIATIQERTNTVDALGQVDLTNWVDVAGLVNLSTRANRRVARSKLPLPDHHRVRGLHEHLWHLVAAEEGLL
jgi:hypothetical protein